MKGISEGYKWATEEAHIPVLGQSVPCRRGRRHVILLGLQHFIVYLK